MQPADTYCSHEALVVDYERAMLRLAHDESGDDQLYNLSAHQLWIGERTRGLDDFHVALAAMIGYLDLRFDGLWAEGRPELASWPDTFGKRFAAYAEMKAPA